MTDSRPSPPSRHHRVKPLFLDALDVPRGRRAAFLGEASGGDESIRREVLELFLLHGDSPLDGMAAPSESPPVPCGQFGPSRVLRLLGSGDRVAGESARLA